MKQRQSVRTTRNIRCTVSTDFIGMSEDNQSHVFAYNGLENLGHEQVKLHGRHLIFEDSNPDVPHIEVPKGSPGVLVSHLTLSWNCLKYRRCTFDGSGFVSGSFSLQRM